MIIKHRELLETKIDVANTEYEMDNNNLVGALEAIYINSSKKKTAYLNRKSSNRRQFADMYFMWYY